MSAEALEVEKDELARGRADLSPDSQAGESGGETGGGDRTPPPEPPSARRRGRDDRPFPTWMKVAINGVLALLGMLMFVLSMRRVLELLPEPR